MLHAALMNSTEAASPNRHLAIAAFFPTCLSNLHHYKNNLLRIDGNDGTVLHDDTPIQQAQLCLQSVVPDWTTPLSQTLRLHHVPYMHDDYIAFQVPTHCTSIDTNAQAYPTCHSLRATNDTTTVYTTTCHGDEKVPLECAALSLYYATTQPATPLNNCHMPLSDSPPINNHISDYIKHHSQIFATIHGLQTLLLIYILVKYLTYRPPPQPRQRGPLEPFGAPRIRRAAPAATAAPRPPMTLNHLLPARVVLLTGGGPPLRSMLTMREDVLYSPPQSLAPH
eukprot:5952073-Amphidinium_carterae.1